MCLVPKIAKYGLLFVLGLAGVNLEASEEMTAGELIEMQLEDLVSMEIEIKSAGKQETKAFDLPYAGYVVTRDDILKYNILTIPDALRMVPGVQVEQIGGSEWGISVRGSGGRFSRFVLVLVDGRALNNTTFSGVNWDELNLSITQVKQIEVIRGPNADSWGANAVNGIINIITLNPGEGKNNELLLSGGTDSRRNAHFRLNQILKDGWAHAFSASYSETPGFVSSDEQLSEMASNIKQANYQIEKSSDKSRFQLSAGGVRSEISSYWNQYQLPLVTPINIFEEKESHYLQSNWEYQESNNTTIRTRVSLSDTKRASELAIWDSHNHQLDVDIQHKLSEHLIDFGINLRRSESTLIDLNGFPLIANPETVEVDYSGLYFSQTFNLNKMGVSAKIGARLDHNTLTGYEFQPSTRVLWKVSESDRIWFAASEAASIPSTGVNNAHAAHLEFYETGELGNPLPLAVIATQQRSLSNTRVSAIEIGYRHLWKQMNVDMTFFHFDYQDELEVVVIGRPRLSDFPPTTNSYLIQTVEFDSISQYEANGFEVNFLGQLSDDFRVNLAYSFLDVENQNGVENLLSLRADYQILDDLSLALWKRYSSGNETFMADSYAVYDLNLNYQIGESLSIKYSAKNYGEEDFEEGRREFFSPGVFMNTPSQNLLLSWQF